MLRLHPCHVLDGIFFIEDMTFKNLKRSKYLMRDMVLVSFCWEYLCHDGIIS